MAWAAGPGTELPTWVSRLRFAEHFRIPPHTVGGVPVAWWQRWIEWEGAKAMRAAREAVERHGMANVDDETRRLYNRLILHGRS